MLKSWSANSIASGSGKCGHSETVELEHSKGRKKGIPGIQTSDSRLSGGPGAGGGGGWGGRREQQKQREKPVSFKWTDSGGGGVSQDRLGVGAAGGGVQPEG